MTADSSERTLPAPLARMLAGIEPIALVAVGIMTFVVGYVITTLIVVVGPSETAGGLTAVALQLGLIFYSAHLVPANLSGGGQFDWLSTVAANPGDPAVPLIVFYAIPMVLLIASAVLAIRTYTTDRLDPREVLGAVVFLAIGYAVMAVLGTFLVQARLQDQTASPDLFLAAVFGLLYPLIFGAIGAGLANVVESLRDLELF